MKQKKFSLLFLTLILVLLLSALTIYADEKGSITFSYVTDNVEFSLYKVGERNNKDGSFVLDGKFAGYSVDLTDSIAAYTLSVYAKRDNLVADMSVKTDSTNTAFFDNLDNGIYLIVGNIVEKNNVKYTPSPVLTLIDNKSSLKIQGKFEAENNSVSHKRPGGGSSSSSVTTKEVSVVKVWKGDIEKSEIVVQLLKNGEVEEEKTLNSKNNWRYTWKSLDKKDDWTVVEKSVPDGCKVSIEKEGNSFIITNTSDKEEPTQPEETTKSEQPTEPDTSEEPFTYNRPDDSSDNTDNPNSSENSDNPSGNGENNSDEYDEFGNYIGNGSGNGDGYNSGRYGENDNYASGKQGSKGGNEKLPQTGQLWWPVGILACLGVFSVIVGVGYKRTGK